jgi:hypothetical protein
LGFCSLIPISWHNRSSVRGCVPAGPERRRMPPEGSGAVNADAVAAHAARTERRILVELGNSACVLQKQTSQYSASPFLGEAQNLASRHSIPTAALFCLFVFNINLSLSQRCTRALVAKSVFTAYTTRACHHSGTLALNSFSLSLSRSLSL